VLAEPLAWKQHVVARGCRRAGADCQMPLQAHHVVSQANLRKHGKEAHLWDTRNGMCLCYAHHRRHDAAVARIPFRLLHPWNIQFAVEHQLDYLLDRYYPKEERVETHEEVVEATAVIEGPGQAEKCPTCERALPRPHADEETKLRKGWTIAVPVAELENGADVLDGLLEECRKTFGHDSNKKVRYYTLSQALALVVQNAHRMAADD
jgi:hypothetical protein